MNSFHYARKSDNVSIELLSKLIETGGRHRIFDKDDFGRNPLHIVCTLYASSEMVSQLIDVGGEDLVLTKTIKAASHSSMHLVPKPI